MAFADRQALFPERPHQIQGAGILVGLHADHGDKRFAAGTLYLAHDAGRSHSPIGLVERVDPDLDAVAQNLAHRAIPGKPFKQASVLEGIAERSHWMG